MKSLHNSTTARNRMVKTSTMKSDDNLTFYAEVKPKTSSGEGEGGAMACGV